VGRTLVANRLLARSACGKRRRGRPLNAAVRHQVYRASKWMAQPEIDFGCADISYRWESEARAKLVVLMHFSRIVDGHAMDLEIVFSNPFAVMWEEESFGLIDSPHELPKCAAPQFKDWAFPTLIIEGSPWAQRYADRRYSDGDPEAERVNHYFLVSLNDELHVLNYGEPQSRWKEPVDA
jgi:hypothetical protein